MQPVVFDVMSFLQCIVEDFQQHSYRYLNGVIQQAGNNKPANLQLHLCYLLGFIALVMTLAI